MLAEAAARRPGARSVPVEATAALAMLLLRDHGILTVHFAALPPGTSALLLKFVPPETLERFGGPERFAAAVDESLDALAALVGDRESLAGLLGSAGALTPVLAFSGSFRGSSSTEGAPPWPQRHQHRPPPRRRSGSSRRCSRSGG